MSISSRISIKDDFGMFTPHQTFHSIPCCECGISIQPNVANMCVKCLRSKVDITQGLLRKLKLVHCPECESYLQPPTTWIKLQLESKEFLSFCLKKLEKNMKSKTVRLVFAQTIPTEPNSNRVKIMVKVQKEVLNKAILEQSYDVEFFRLNQMCKSCTRVQANPDQWISVVQLRQQVSHMRTFFHLEQLILKHGVNANAVRIKQMNQGIDLFFSNQSNAIKIVDFVKGQVPVRISQDKQLVSHDTKSNNYNYRYTFSVEIIPICCEDLIYLPRNVASSLGNLGPFVICTNVAKNIALLDPFTLRHCFLDVYKYWKAPFKSLLTSKQLVKYVVIDVEEVYYEVTIGGKKYGLANVEVARMKDYGENDTRFNIRTHLGHLLKSGDYALGYDLYGANSSNNDIELDEYKGGDAILIKKCYEEKCQKRCGKRRSCKRKSLDMEIDDNDRVEEDKKNSEYEQFLKDLEDNPNGRFNISLSQNEDYYQLSEMESVEQSMDDLHLSDEKYEARRKLRRTA